MKRECESCIKRKTTYCPTSMECMATDDMPYYQNRIMLLEENQELKKQLEYFRSNEYLNQLRFERNMLQDVVNKGEVSKEDKDFIDCTHRNTELLEENRKLHNDKLEYLTKYTAMLSSQDRFIKYLEDESKQIYRDGGLRQNIFRQILQKYKKIIGDDR